MGAVIHSVMVLLSCRLVCYTSSFLPVFSVSPTSPTQHSHLIFFLAVSFFGVGLLVIVFTALQILSLLVLDVEFSEFLLWNGYTLVFFCGLFLVLHTELVLGSILFDLGVPVGLLIRVPLRRTTLIPASSSKREVG